MRRRARAKRHHDPSRALILTRHREGSLVIVDNAIEEDSYVVGYTSLSLFEEVEIPRGSLATVLEVRSSWVKILCGVLTCWIYTEWLQAT